MPSVWSIQPRQRPPLTPPELTYSTGSKTHEKARPLQLHAKEKNKLTL